MPPRYGINVTVGLNTKQFREGLNHMADRLRKSGRRLSIMGAELMRNITLPFGLAAGASLKFAADLDATQRALKAVMGSSERAEKHFVDLKKAARAPGLEFGAAIKGSIRLQSMGVQASRAERMLTALGKATELSAGGADEFGRAINQLSDIISRGKVTMEDWKRLAMATPAILGAVKKEFGSTDVVAIVEELGSVDVFLDRLTDRLNAMQGSGGSLKNTFQNLGNELTLLAGTMGLLGVEATDFQSWLDGLVTKISDFTIRLHEDEAAARRWGKAIKYAAAAMMFLAGTGLVTRLVGNLKILASLFIDIAKQAFTLAARLNKLRKSMMTLEALRHVRLVRWARGIKAIGVEAVLANTKVGKLTKGLKGLAGTKGAAILGRAGLAGVAVAAAGGAIAAAGHAGVKDENIPLEDLKSWIDNMESEAAGEQGRFKQILRNFWEDIFGTTKVYREQYERRLAEWNKKKADAEKTLPHQMGLPGADTKYGPFANEGNFPDEVSQPIVELTEAQKEARKAAQEFANTLAELKAEFKVTGNAGDFYEGMVTALTNRLVEMELAGMGSSAAFKALNAQLSNMRNNVRTVELLAQAAEQLPDMFKETGERGAGAMGSQIFTRAFGTMEGFFKRRDIPAIPEEVRSASTLPMNVDFSDWEDFLLKFPEAENEFQGIEDALEKVTQQFQTLSSVGRAAMPVFEGLFGFIGEGFENMAKNAPKFIQQVIKAIAKLIQKLVAAAVVAVVLAAVTGGGSAIGEGAKFAVQFKKFFSVLSGFKLARGGIVPSGYPNDSYPAWLSSGEVVLPAQKAPLPLPRMQDSSSGGVGEFVIRGRDLVTAIRNNARFSRVQGDYL